MRNQHNFTDEQMAQRLKDLQKMDGGEYVETASFNCPVCGIRPMLFTGNKRWAGGTMLECFCLAPFSPKVEHEIARKEAGGSFWDYPMCRNADAWGMFVQWKLEQPAPVEDENDES